MLFELSHRDYFPRDNSHDQSSIYSYLMGVQALDQNIFPEVLGMTKVF